MVERKLNSIVAVILAGGFGTRIRHLLPNIPKPMAEVAGRPFLEWVLRYLRAQGINTAVLSTGYLAEKIEDYFAKDPLPGMRLFFARETDPLGTAGGFLNAVKQSGLTPPTWMVLNGDSLALTDLAAPEALLEYPKTQGVLIGVKVPDATRYGSLAIAPDGQLQGFREKQPGAGVISAGMYLLRQQLLHQFASQRPLSFEVDVFPDLLKRNHLLRVATTDAHFLDIGTPESLAQADDFIRTNQQWFS